MIQNGAGFPLKLADQSLTAGAYANGKTPPQKIAKGSGDNASFGVNAFKVLSSNANDGDAGYVTYQLGDGTQFKFSFTNPASGSNVYSCDISGDSSNDYTCGEDGSDGGNTVATYTIFSK
jgi:hypothetical protein